MRKLDNTEVKKYILNILCEFAAFCDQNGLRYYLSGGTLLGAVRHMLDEEYETLKANACKIGGKLRRGYFLKSAMKQSI